MRPMTLRHATLADAPALADLGARTFIDTFVDGFGIPYPQTDLDAFMAEVFSEATIRQAIAAPGVEWLVAEDGSGRIVAFATTGPCRLPHPDASPANAELKRLYVDRSAQGAGHGTTLLKAALARMDRDFTGPQWIGVWSGNLKAQRLYAAYGFEKAGEYQFPVGAWRDDEFILRKG